MTRPGFSFSTRFKVRYAEVDAQRVVYNSRYLEYADVVATEYWPWTGMEALGADWMEAEFHVRHTEIDYHRPFVMGDEIEAFMRIDRIGGTSMTQRFELCHAATGDLHCTILMTIVHVDLATGRPKAIEGAVRDGLLKLVGV